MAANGSGYLLLLVLVCFAGAGATQALAQGVEEPPDIDGPVENDLYLAHRVVEVSSRVDGDVVAAGGQVTIDGDVTGDIIAAARTIDIQAPVGDDVRAAGQHVRILSPVSGHLVAAGQTVTVAQPVGEWAWLAGMTVEVTGDIGGDLSIRAKNVLINAQVLGDVDIIGDELEVGPLGAIRGDLRWQSQSIANINPEAQIDGELIEESPPSVAEQLADGRTYRLPLNTIVAVTVLFLLFSRAFRASAARIEERPGRSILTGAAVFVVAPTLAIGLFYSGVGVQLGFAVVLIFFAVLLLGVLTGLFAISDVLLRRFQESPDLRQSIVAIFATVVVVGLLAKIPWAGFALIVLILLTGMGALCWTSWSTLRGLGNQRPSQT